MLQAACLKCHGWKESEYHPLNYKTKPCEDKKCNGNLECPFYHGNHDKRIVTPQNASEVMMPRMRSQVEQQIFITHSNLVISNVNHLKELLLNYKLAHFNFH